MAKGIAAIVREQAPRGVVRDQGALNRALVAYARELEPWARKVAEKMIAEVAARDRLAWSDLGLAMGREIRGLLDSSDTGAAFHTRLAEQIQSITAMPLDAAVRVAKLRAQGLREGERAEVVAKRIMEQGRVSKSQAKQIARTQVATTQSVFTETRAKAVGSKGYIWRTAMDEDVRPALHLPAKVRAKFIGSHRKLEGQFIPWNKPPVSGSKGERAHAGQIWNCRCWCEPVLPDLLTGVSP